MTRTSPLSHCPAEVASWSCSPAPSAPVPNPENSPRGRLEKGQHLLQPTRGRQGSPGSRKAPFGPLCPSWDSPTLGCALEAMGMTTEAPGSQPLAQHHLNFLFLWGNLQKTQFSLLHPWAEKRERGSWTIISQQLLVSKISGGEQVQASREALWPPSLSDLGA